MRLHENAQLFREAIKTTSDLYNIISLYIEKDYWVTFALK